MLRYWRVKFTDKREGTGWFVSNDDTMENFLTDDDGNIIETGVCYEPTEFESRPRWADGPIVEARLGIKIDAPA